MVKKLAAALLLGLAFILPGWSDISTAVTIEGLTLAARQDDGDMGVNAATLGKIDFLALGNKNVKGELEINAYIGDKVFPGPSPGYVDANPAYFTIPRAYIKIRFPSIRMTFGKTAVSWGHGFLFNAGDVIFGGMDVNADLTRSVLRDSTVTQILLTKYLGTLSYVELILLPISSFDLGSGELMSIELWQASAGARIVFPIGKTSLEIGYLYKGDTDNNGNGYDFSHNPYLSFSSGFFGIGDFYLAASCSAVNEADSEAVLDSIKTSAGISVSIKAGRDGTVNLRFETGITPFARWSESSGGSAAYGIYLYPEVSYTPKDNLSFQLRSIVSPVDGSGIIMAGTGWNPYQGLTFNFFAAAMFGDSDDTFGWDRSGGLLLMLNAEYVFGD